MKIRKSDLGIDFKDTRINFKYPKKIFPARYTKIRMPTDLINILETKGRHMTRREFFDVKNKLENWNEKDFEFYAKRDKKGIKFLEFGE